MIPLLRTDIVHHKWQHLVDTLRRETGQDLIEYGLLAGLIALVAVAAVHLTGVEIGNWWAYIGNRVSELLGGQG